MTPNSITFVSQNRALKGREVTLTVGDRVRFHEVGTPSFYVGRVRSIDTNAQKIRVLIERSFTGRGNASLHRWRNGQTRDVSVHDVYELVSRETDRADLHLDAKV